MESHERYLKIKCDLVSIRAELKRLYDVTPLNVGRIEFLTKQEEEYKKEIRAINKELRQVLQDSEDLKTKVYIWRFYYKWPLKKIAIKSNYSLSHIKRISSLLYKEGNKI